MTERKGNPGPDPNRAASKAQADANAARAKQEAARAEREAEQAERVADKEEEKLQEEEREGSEDAEAEEEGAEAEAEDADADEGSDASEEPAAEDEADAAEDEAEEEPEDEVYVVKAKPELDDAARLALAAREAKQRANPKFRRHEWWRYKDLGGKHAPWRRPRGIHSKQRRHYKYRPPVVSIGYRTPAAARGLHPSGFAEVLVHRPEDLAELDPKTQAARVGRTVGGRKAEAIQAKADELGIRILNRRQS